MTDDPESKEAPAAMPAKPARRAAASADEAFDLWLERGLHAVFDKVTQETIPPELLALIEKHRRENG